MRLSPLQRRLFIALDEWAGVLTLLHMQKTDNPYFIYTLAFWAFAIYVIAYPWHWWLEHKGR